MLIPVLLFALGLVLLIKGGDWFVDGATGLARRFHIPEIIVGATVVSIGTTFSFSLLGFPPNHNGISEGQRGSSKSKIPKIKNLPISERICQV